LGWFRRKATPSTKAGQTPDVHSPRAVASASSVPIPTPATSASLAAISGLPRHVAVIMDGNGRWARTRGLPRIEGHRRGADTVRRISEACGRLGIPYLTLYCFSNENWKRPAEELSFLMSLLKQYLIRERATLVERQVRLKIIGRREGLPADVLQEMDQSVALSQHHTGLTLCLAINYGARQELVDAVRRIGEEVRVGSLPVEEIGEQTIQQRLYTSELPDPDLVIRTSGEMRVSNFLLWQISYSELWVTTKAWPEFSEDDFAEALADFSQRQRRFGAISPPGPP
jgi:undecaprenyl diphosphate synthase